MELLQSGSFLKMKKYPLKIYAIKTIFFKHFLISWTAPSTRVLHSAVSNMKNIQGVSHILHFIFKIIRNNSKQKKRGNICYVTRSWYAITRWSPTRKGTSKIFLYPLPLYEFSKILLFWYYKHTQVKVGLSPSKKICVIC